MCGDLPQHSWARCPSVHWCQPRDWQLPPVLTRDDFGVALGRGEWPRGPNRGYLRYLPEKKNIAMENPPFIAYLCGFSHANAHIIIYYRGMGPSESWIPSRSTRCFSVASSSGRLQDIVIPQGQASHRVGGRGGIIHTIRGIHKSGSTQPWLLRIQQNRWRIVDKNGGYQWKMPSIMRKMMIKHVKHEYTI